MVCACRNPVLRRNAAGFRGFTLIELMIAIVVVGILSAVAYPLYSDFVRRSRITDATSQMNDLRIRQDQAFQDRRRFDDGGGNCAINAQLPAFNAARDNFQFTCVFAAGILGGYTLQAVGNANLGMAGFTYRLNVDPATGAVIRDTASVPASWMPLPAPNTCWQVQKGGKC